MFGELCVLCVTISITGGEKNRSMLSSSACSSRQLNRIFSKLIMLHIKIRFFFPVFLWEGCFHSETLKLFSDFQLSIFLPFYSFCWWQCYFFSLIVFSSAFAYSLLRTIECPKSLV